MTDASADPLPLGLAAGREEAFEALYDRYADRLYRAALGMLGRSADAEDAVQEVFVAMVRSRERLASVRDLTSYVFAALRHAAARCAARRARAGEALRAAAAEAAGQAGRADRGDPRADRLETALRALPAEQREVIALKLDGGLTFGQIGEVLGVMVNTAASRYRYALESLRRRLAR